MENQVHAKQMHGAFPQLDAVFPFLFFHLLQANTSILDSVISYSLSFTHLCSGIHHPHKLSPGLFQ